MTRPKFIFPTLGIIFVFLAFTAAPEVFAAPISFNNDSEIGRSGDDGLQAGCDASHYPAPTSSSSSLAGAGQGGTASDASQDEQLTGPTGDAPNPQSWDSAASTAVHGFEAEDSRVERLLIPRAAASTASLDTDDSRSSSLTLKRKKKKKGKGKAVDYEDLRDNEYRGRYSKQKGNGKAQFYYPSSRMRQFESESSSSSSESHSRYSKRKGNGEAQFYYPSSRMRQFESESSSSSSESHSRYSKRKGNGEAQFYYPSSRMRQFESESSGSSSISGSSGSANFGSSGSANFGSSGSSSESGSSSGSSSESGPSTARGHRPRPPTVRHSEAAPSHAAPSPSHNTQQTIFDELEATLQGYEAELHQMIAQSVTFGVFRAFVTRVDDLATDISHQAASTSPAHHSDAQWPALIDRVQKLSFECKEAAKRAGIAYNRGLGREDAVHAIASGQISYDELHHNYRPVYAPPTQEAGPSHQGQEGSAWHAPGSGAHTQQSGGGYSYYGTWPAHGDEGHGYGEHGYDAYGYEGHGYEGHGYEGHGYGDQGYGQHRYGEHAYGENGDENHGYGEHTYEGHTYGGHGNEPWPENGQYGH
ncbi:hypothetical protein F5878DRAFT_728171 [Lentinula raphanica]|uniref:Uncharacterized protein n=1 Tax=Lentinula raphanica TaxID=153919 RepID=A0AA38P1R1_9AGAR|nr:hypothetical protein F5878DRAFT_728171 [Lentinula raphanica]